MCITIQSLLALHACCALALLLMQCNLAQTRLASVQRPSDPCRLDKHHMAFAGHTNTHLLFPQVASHGKPTDCMLSVSKNFALPPNLHIKWLAAGMGLIMEQITRHCSNAHTMLLQFYCWLMYVSSVICRQGSALDEEAQARATSLALLYSLLSNLHRAARLTVRHSLWCRQ